MRLKPPRRRVMADLVMIAVMRRDLIRCVRWIERTMSCSMDAVSGVLTVVDTWSGVCPVMRVCRSATAMEIIDPLDRRHIVCQR